MVFPYKWFRLPWAVAGTKVAPPDPTQGDGSLSYNEGFGADYSLDPGTNPSALLIPRDKTNGLYYDITLALQYIQSGLTPAWIDSTTNGGSAYPYALGARVLYTDGFTYTSQSAANTDTPGATANWVRARSRLSANMNFYVATAGNGGSDNNAGTAGSPWLTIQHAINVLSQNYDLNGFAATVNIGAGTFAGFRIDAPLIGALGPSSLIFNGASAATTILSSVVLVDNAAVCTINGLTFAGGGISSLLVSSFATVYVATAAPVTFPVNTGGIHVNASNNGIVTLNGNYNITGGASAHLNSTGLGNVIFQTGTCTLTGTPAFTGAFANASVGSLIQASPGVFSGAATGTRYNAQLNSIINTNAAGANYFPGSIAGSTATGGQYV